MSTYEQLLDRFRDRSASVGILGLGYVGLPVALSFAEAGYHVFGVDVDQDKIDRLSDGLSSVPDIPDRRVRDQFESDQIEFSTDTSVIGECDAVLICVPTPLRKSRDPDVTYIIQAVEDVAEHLESPSLVILESTTYPGTTEELVIPTFEQAGWELDEDVFVAYSPERIDPANEQYDFENTPKVVGGATEQAGELAEACYEQVIDEVVPVTDDQTAEMVKLLENTFRAVNIGLANEMARLCDRIGVDVWEVVRAASTKPYGFMPFYPGPGLGGHCIPVDPLFLSWKARTLDTSSRFIELADEVNRSMPGFVVDKIFTALNEVGKPISGSRIVIFGVAYKSGVGDTRESPAEEIVRLLRGHGADLYFCDPYVEQFEVEGEPVEKLPEARVNSPDAGVVVTAHDEFDWPELLAGTACVVDSRGVITRDQYPEGPLHRI